MIARLIVAALATYRLAQLVAIDDGPLEMFRAIRAFTGKQAARGFVFKSFADLVHCPYCIGVWFAAILAIFLQPNGIAEWFVFWMAVAGLQTAIQAVTYRGDE